MTLTQVQTPGLQFSQKRDHLSPSSLCEFARCPRRFFYSRSCGLQAGDEEHLALTYGKAMHAAIPIIMESGLDEGYAAFEKIWGQRADEKGLRSNVTAMRSLSEFYEKNGEGRGMYTLVKPSTLGVPRLDPPPRSDHPDKTEVSEWEFEFRMDIGLHVPFEGRLDGLARLNADRSLWVVEYKTSAQIGGNWFFDAFDLSPQLCAYTLAARTVIQDEPIRGVIVVVIRTSKTNPESVPKPIDVRDHHLEDFVTWAQYKAREIKAAEDSGIWNKDFSGCHPYAMFGTHGYKCDFMPMCRDTEDWTSHREFYRQKDSKVDNTPLVQIGVK